MMMKRTYSDGECDVFSDSNTEKNCETNQEVSCHVVIRKKRRGIIEKRRRDRINNSLAELRRLVPAAYEKQGSTKLEKAEILQLTVDHLKMIHAKGLDVLAYDPHKLAMDYHNLGFRECAAEVARYFVTVEGMDLQDPLRLRLMSHLQCFSAQRDIAAKQATTWSFPNAGSNVYGPSSTQPSAASHSGLMASHLVSNQNLGGLENATHSMTAFSAQSSLGVSMFNESLCSNQSINRLSSSSTPMSSIPQTSQSSYQYANFNSFPGMGTILSTQSSGSGYSSPSAQVKPYRPWGAELAY